MKRALITGVGGQDGSYLAEYLLALGYEVHGTIRMMDLCVDYLTAVIGRVHFHYADLTDAVSLEKVIRRVHPDEIYNLAGQVFVPTSWSLPAETFDSNVGGLARILCIAERVCPNTRVYQASTSEMYGNVLGVENNDTIKLDENSNMHPVSPYGVSKYAAHKLVDVYRQKGMYVVSGILFNHEGPRRGSEMVTRKITKHVARWASGDWTALKLGNLKARRDWGFAGDYVKAMHAMLQVSYADDYVIGTGQAHSVQEFLREAIVAARLQDMDCESHVVSNSSEFSRPTELHCLVADYTKANRILGWEPKTSFRQLVGMMVEHDMLAYSAKAEAVRA